ncbi:MAG: DUF6351 family protein, partial [Acidimicrobiia bacterium]|nr:DUF6351 family protein [Acidimicrobiia bacterium]
LPFADMITTMPGAMDCELLNAYYATEQGAELTADQRAAINGQLVAGACPFVEEVFGPTWSPAQGCDPSLAGQVYNPFFNPDGPLRCTPFDAHWRLFVPNRGEQPGVVVPPFDNSGVQYGLRAYQDGMIGLGQFLDLNQFVGGRGTDGQVVADRTRANRAQLERMYADGRVNQAGGDLRRIPIVLIDVFTDAAGDVHDRWRAFTIAERIGGGSSEPAPNVALWTVQTPLTSQFTLADYFATAGGTNLSALSLEALRAVDEWATAAAEQAGDAPAVDLAESRPDSAADRCQLITGDVVTGPAVNRPGGACGDLPISGDPRTAAGADIEALVLACTLRDIDLTDYRGELSTNAVARLERIFPDGVCDYERPGRGQVRLGEPYREY